MPKSNTLLGTFLRWRVRHIPQNQFILILSVLVGLITGLVAVTLKNVVHLIQEFISNSSWHQVYYFVFPVIGIFIVVFVKRFYSGPIGEGVPSTLFAISRRNGFLKPYRMYASIITSAITVGLGGSVGLEGPTVSTGSAIGSNLAKAMHLNYKSRILLISCATAGAISSIFNAPITGIIFTIEIFSLDLTMASLVPLLLASVSGAITSMFIQDKNDYLFHYDVVQAFDVNHIPAYVGLALLSAVMSVYFHKMYFATDKFMTFLGKRKLKTIVGGIILGLIIFLIPPLYGEGYETINALLAGNESKVVSQSFLSTYATDVYFVIALLFGLALLKVFATSLTLGAGGVGGIFAPTLFMGAVLGYVYAKTINLFNVVNISTSNFALVGMAGLMAGVLHAPFTAIFMIAEVSGGYKLFLPIMITSTLSYLFTRSVTPYSIYTVTLARRGDLITHNKDKAVLTLMRLESVVENDFIPVQASMRLGELVDVFKKSSRNIFPVINKEGKLVGVLTLDDFKQLLFDTSLHKSISVSDLMLAPPAVVSKDESMDSVMQKFQSTGAWNLPVLDEEKYIGFISKSKLFNAYRRKLIEMSN
jgi:CIC family chloride channel protein